MKVLGVEKKLSMEKKFNSVKTKLTLSKYRFLDTTPYFSLSVKLHYRKANCEFLTKIRCKSKKKSQTCKARVVILREMKKTSVFLEVK